MSCYNFIIDKPISFIGISIWIWQKIWIIACCIFETFSRNLTVFLTQFYIKKNQRRATMSLQMHISVQVHWSTKYSSSPSKLPCHNFALCIFLCLFCICVFNNRRCVLCLQNWPAIICHQLPYAPQKGTLRSNMSFIHKPRSIFCRIHWKLWSFEISKQKR